MMSSGGMQLMRSSYSRCLTCGAAVGSGSASPPAGRALGCRGRRGSTPAPPRRSSLRARLVQRLRALLRHDLPPDLRHVQLPVRPLDRLVWLEGEAATTMVGRVKDNESGTRQGRRRGDSRGGGRQERPKAQRGGGALLDHAGFEAEEGLAHVSVGLGGCGRQEGVAPWAGQGAAPISAPEDRGRRCRGEASPRTARRCGRRAPAAGRSSPSSRRS